MRIRRVIDMPVPSLPGVRVIRIRAVGLLLTTFRIASHTIHVLASE